jgi:hypothetical protein
VTLLTYTIPTAGVTPNSTAAPEVDTALQSILTWANQNVDSANISPTSGYTRLAWRSAPSSTTANLGDLLNAAGGITITLPAPTTNNGTVAIWANMSVSNSSLVTVSGTAIYGAGLNDVSSFALGIAGVCVLLQSNGSAWVIVSGTGNWNTWQTLVLGSNIGSFSAYLPSARLNGDMVELSGTLQNNTGGAVFTGTTIATIPAGLRPAGIVTLPLVPGGGQPQISTSGVLALQNGNWNSGALAGLDGLTYRLV